MDSVLSEECQYHSETYSKYFDDEKEYLKITGKIVESAGEKRRKFVTIFKNVRTSFYNFSTPLIFDDANLYTKKTTDSQMSKMRTLGIANGDGRFTEWFFDKYIELYDESTDLRKKMLICKKDSEILDDIQVDIEYDYINTMDVIRENPHVKYHLKNGAKPRKLDYFETSKLQIIKLNHVGGNPVVQLPLKYHYYCDECESETDKLYSSKSLHCGEDGCGGKLIRSPSMDSVRPVFASRVVTDDLNNIPIISLTEIPQGEFIGAGFLCRNKSDYYLFLVATEEIELVSSTIKIDKKTHAVWQIIKQIDAIHEERIGKHIHGLEWYKAAILMAYLANRKGRVSTNLLVVGPPGIGKTSTPRFYMATLTPQQKVQDAMNLSGPGLHGSMAQIKIGDAVVNVPEAGMLSRYNLVVIDEMFENRHNLLPQLKTALMSSTLTREIHGMRTQTPKYATAIATSNIIPSVLAEQNRWMMHWINDHSDQYDTTSLFTRNLAHKEMKDEWKTRGLEWRSGQPMPDMDRWPLIFFVRDPIESIHEYDLGGEDMAIDDLELAKRLYESNIDDYFKFHGKIEVNWRPHSAEIIQLVEELQKHDTIHSKKRLSQNITLMLQLSAQINGRAELTDDDFEFVRGLWMKTCDWIDVSDLEFDDITHTITSSTWDIERIKKRVHEYMTDCVGTKYYMTPRGFSMIASRLEDEGASASLVDNTIEHYKQNPNQ